MMRDATALSKEQAATGIPGLDHVLCGGLPRDRLYLVEGDPGSGKTTLGLQFLLHGAASGEPGLYVTLSETKEELEAVAGSHGWSLDPLAVHELSADAPDAAADHYTLFHPSEVELGEVTKAVLQQVERIRAARVVFDSLSEMRLLARDPLRYRRQILALKQFFIGRRCTVLLLDDRTTDVSDLQLQSLAHGVISMEQVPILYGKERRRLRVRKMRGLAYRGGFHDFTITRGGIVVYPRLVAADHRREPPRSMASSGIPALDALLGGGLDRGSSTLVLGPAGTGKSSLAVHYAAAAAARGERAVLYIFDESLATLKERSAGLGIPLAEHLQSGMVRVQQLDPAEISPGEFACGVIESVRDDQAQVVIIDSLNGYLNAMPEEHFLSIQLHELLTFLGQQGVVTILVAAQHGLLGDTMRNVVDVSYLADTVILLRYFESMGAVRQAISVMKKRSGRHERTIRDFSMGSDGLRIGDPLREFRGVLTGAPEYTGIPLGADHGTDKG